MTSTVLTERIKEELDLLAVAIAKNDVETIETVAIRISAMLCDLKRELTAQSTSSGHDFTPIVSAAKRCSVFLQRARLALNVLRNLHELFASEHTYGVRG